jgi:tol-pal system protein YbgF
MMTRSDIARVFAAALAGMTLAAAAGQALAQTPIDSDPLDDRSKRRLDNMEKVVRELRGIVYQGRNTGKPIVIQSAETDSVVQTLTTRVEDLEQSLKRTTADNETQLRDLDQARKDLAAAKDHEAALEARLGALEAKVAAGLAPPPPAEQAVAAPLVGAPPAPAVTPAAAFAAANKLLLDGDYPNAESAFADFVQRYPTDARAAEANYHLGQTLTARTATADAAGAYIAAIRGYPKTAWAPDAMLQLSRALLTLGDQPNACKVLVDLATRYPMAPTPVQSRAATTRAQAKCAA